MAAMLPYFAEQFYNPSATYLAAKTAGQALAAARHRVAERLGARASEVVFTAGGSEANNLAIHGVMRQYPDANIIVCAIEHDSILAPARRYDYRVAPVTEQGIVDLAALDQLIDDRTVMVSIMYANNEIGTIQPLKQIAELIRQKRRTRTGDRPLLLHSDASQAANYLDIHVSRLGVDLLTLNGGKVYGPKQSGALFVKAGLTLEPLVDGGGQEQGLRSGTENVASAVGFATALDLAQTMRKAEAARLSALQRHFIKAVTAAVPAAVLNGSATKRLPNNVHLTFPGCDNERLIMQLDEAGIMTAAGSACSASKEQASHVLAALGLDEATAHSSVRFSFGRGTTEADLERVVAELRRLLA